MPRSRHCRSLRIQGMRSQRNRSLGIQEMLRSLTLHSIPPASGLILLLDLGTIPPQGQQRDIWSAGGGAGPPRFLGWPSPLLPIRLSRLLELCSPPSQSSPSAALPFRSPTWCPTIPKTPTASSRHHNPGNGGKQGKQGKIHGGNTRGATTAPPPARAAAPTPPGEGRGKNKDTHGHFPLPGRT